MPVARFAAINHHSTSRARLMINRRSRLVFLASASVLGMVVAGSAASARGLNGGSAVQSAPNIATDDAARAAQQAIGVARQTQDSLARAARAMQNMQAMQAAARAAAIARQTSLTAPVNVPNGLGAGGLQVAPGAVPGSSLWRGAAAPTQNTDSSGQTQVGIRQTAQQAILNWDSFNVGSRTTLTFDQQGNVNWTVLNRVVGAAAPSQILGTIRADGQVLVVNQNGIIFGGGSQVNVGSLIASTAGITDTQFLVNGIYSTQSNGRYDPSFTGARASIVVEEGALIATSVPTSVTAGGGLVALLGSDVANAGSLSLPKGQALLAAGDDFVFRRGVSTVANQISTTRGSEVVALRGSDSSNGAVSNRGLIFSPQGDITLTGHSVLQDGVLISTTSVNQRGTIHLLNSIGDASGRVTLTGNALTTIVPELGTNETALNSQRDALITDSAKQDKARIEAPTLTQFDNLSRLADRQDQSRIEIVTGGEVVFKTGSLTMAQGGQVSVMASKGIALDTAAVIDVSGTVGFALAMNTNVVKVNVQGFELRDSPVNRDSGGLKNANVYIDTRDLVLVTAGTGGYASDRYYTRGGLLEISGYLSNTGHTIGEWTAVGGSVTLSAPEVTAEKGAIMNLAGGALSYAAGNIITSNVLGADGRIYGIGNAPSGLSILGPAGRFARTHNIQGRVDDRLTEVWASIFDRGGVSVRYEEAYSVGRDGGQLNLLATTSDFKATMVADVLNDKRQISARSKGMTDGYKATQTTAALAGRFALGDLDRNGWTTIGTGAVAFGAGQPPADFDTTADFDPKHWFDAAILSGFRLGGISVSSLASVDVLAPLSLASGGVVSLSGSKVTIDGNIVARGGSIAIDGTAELTVKQGVTLDARGLWTNASIDPAADRSRTAFINGGSITLSSARLKLGKESRLDTSAGGIIQTNRKTTGGDGGDISLSGRDQLVLDGKVASYGFGKGGKLSISTSSSIAIGGMPLRQEGQLAAGEAAPLDLVLAEPLELAAGTKAPFGIDVSQTSLANGDTVPAKAVLDRWRDAIVGPAGWTVPVRGFIVNGMFVAPGTTLDPGTAVRADYGTSLAGYTIPPGTFIGGLPIEPLAVHVVGGGILPANATLAAGSTVPRGTVLGVNVAVRPLVVLDPSLFDTGFSSYAVRSPIGVAVLPGTQLSITQPVFQFSSERFDAVTGSDLRDAVLPPLFLPNLAKGALTQRGGADLIIGNPTERDQISFDPMLVASAKSQGSFALGRGATITVDPGRSVSIGGTGQITIDGLITARGGAITIVNNARQEDITLVKPYVASGRSVWIGDEARLDASGYAETATDIRGRRYGNVIDGGVVTLGAVPQAVPDSSLRAGNAFVVLRPGSVIDVSGASAVIDLVSASDGVQSRLVASDGGVISLASHRGIVMDGTMRAAAGGDGASGGTLALMLETPILPLYANTNTWPVVPIDPPAEAKVGRVITVSQTYTASGMSGSTVAGALDSKLKLGEAQLGVDQVVAGGFSSLSLWARGALAFEGDVSLSLSRSLTLQQGSLVNTVASGRVALNAPYVFLDGRTRQYDSTFDSGEFAYRNGWGQYKPDVIPNYPKGAALSISGSLIDVRNQVLSPYDKTEIASAGDLRILAGTAPAYQVSANDPFVSILAASGDLTLTAGQIYPASGARGMLAAGVSVIVSYDGTPQLAYGTSPAVLKIARQGDVPAMPYSVFGTISLRAETIEQGGVIRAPFGAITIGDDAYGQRAKQITLRPGSITSISTRGLVIPYGGTADGVNYTANGAAPWSLNPVTGMDPRQGNPMSVGITLAAGSIISEPGSLVDLSGGGMLTGAGFVSGRGGSVDTLLTPLVNSNPANSYSAAGNKVYAVVPGIVTAPMAGGSSDVWKGNIPGIGEQVTIPAGIPGLPAGTYTLMPANYALLPGAYRVEIASKASRVVADPLATGTGSYIAYAYHGIANTGFRDALPTQIIVTPGTAVRKLSQYNEQGFAAFVASQARQFGTLRKMTEIDARALNIFLRTKDGDSGSSGLIFNGKADFKGGEGGVDGAFSVSGRAVNGGAIDLVVTVPGSVTTGNANRATISADAIAAIDAPTLYLGGKPEADSNYNNSIRISGVDNVTLEKGVRLSASNVFLAAENAVLLEEGAIVSTLGRGISGIDASSAGLFFAGGLYGTGALAVISNGDIPLGNPLGTGAAKVTMKRGSGLYSEGSIGFYADQGLATEGDIGIGTRRLALNVPSFNIGSDASLAAVGARLPAGLLFTQSFLDTLLRGGGIAGAPAVQSLRLSAGQAINFFGTVDLNTIDPATGRSRLAELVLATPAIYGYGTAADRVRITTDTLVWSGQTVRDTGAPAGRNVYKSATPGARIAGLGDGGAFAVDARQIVFGYPAQSRPEAASVNRLMLGFTDIAFNAVERITANGTGTFSAYGTGPAVGTAFDPKTYAGTGGALTFNAPLLTVESGGVFSAYGHAVSVASSTGAVAGAAGTLGGNLSLTGHTLRVASAVVLPAGRIALAARGTGGDLVIADGARLDVAGHAIDIGGAKRQAWGGDVLLSSLTGSVVLAAGATVDLSAQGSDAGSLSVTAAGGARLDGALLGYGGGDGARHGAVTVKAANVGGGNLSDGFAAFNRKLTASGFTYSRSFALSGGDLVVGDDVVARNVSISAEGGSLVVAGRIDATGSKTGAIRLAARDDLVVTSSGVLDARGTVLVRDSYGEVIEASNRNSIELTSSQGWVRLAGGATIDTSSMQDATPRGRVEINARRVDETGGDIKIDASAPLNLNGIASLAVNGYWTYSPTDANGTIVQDNTESYAPAGAVGLRQIDAANQSFYNAALNHSGLQGRLAGLRALGNAYHLRPGVEITGGAASGGRLTVLRDLDLSGYRYGPNADRDPLSARYGFGEAMALTIRAAGDLVIKGSINDGFAPPPSSPSDEKGFRDRLTVTVIPAYTYTNPDPKRYYYPSEHYWTLDQDWTVTDGAGSSPFGYVYAAVDGAYKYYYVGSTVPAGAVIDHWSSDKYFAPGETVPALRIVQPATGPLGKIWAIAPMLAPDTMSSSIRLVSGADLAAADMRSLRAAATLAGSGNMLLDDYHTTVRNGTATTTEIFSVIRTGTGDLELLSAGNFTQKTLYGIYTAGSQIDVGARFHLTPADPPPVGNAVASYFADRGGDLLVKVQGDLSGRGLQQYATSLTDDRDQWLAIQGSDVAGHPTAWSINFGSYKRDSNAAGGLSVAGVTGFGTYGGGNAMIAIDGDAGGIRRLGGSENPTGLDAGVGSSGRVENGILKQSGGGNLDIRVGGGLNPFSSGGKLIALRGDVEVAAGSIGSLIVDYKTSIAGDPRGANPYAGSMLASTITGPVLTLGDARVSLRTRGDLGLDGIVDPGLLDTASNNYGEWIDSVTGQRVDSWFSLWRPQTGVDLMSLGGNVALASPQFKELPASFRVAAASANLYVMAAIASGNIQNVTLQQIPAEQAALELVAKGSIYATKSSITMSAADASQMPDPMRPAYVIYGPSGQPDRFNTRSIYNPNWQRNDPAYGRYAFVEDAPLTNLHANDQGSVLVRAATGDIVGLALTTAKRLDMVAAGDIVGIPGFGGSAISILHAQASDVSTITAGGTIYYPIVTIAGPGALSMAAGADIYLGDKGSVESKGAVVIGDKRPGASIALTAGTGASGADYRGVLAYLDPANLADKDRPLADQSGKVAKVYQDELKAWLKERFGYESANDKDSLSYFATRTPEQQQIFLRQVYFAELTAGGREYNDAGSSRYGSYLRGRAAIAALFPNGDRYAGDITMFGAAGVRTIAGGDIQMLTPGGRTVIGVEGPVAPGSAGILTQGRDSNIQIYSKGSVLLGLSRIMTTFGGNIIVWSAEGDINAGRGSKTTTVYTPPKLEYDNYGNATVSPVVPSSGAGIATLDPIPEVKSGDIDLIAPLGTIDAGEAGIRVSGNINLAALQIVNAANIQVQGSSAGIPTVQAPSIAAALSSSNATAATQQTATPNQGSGNERPSVIIVEVLGYGGGNDSEPQDKKKETDKQQTYNQRSNVRVLGYATLSPSEMTDLSDQEKQAIRD